MVVLSGRQGDPPLIACAWTIYVDMYYSHQDLTIGGVLTAW